MRFIDRIRKLFGNASTSQPVPVPKCMTTLDHLVDVVGKSKGEPLLVSAMNLVEDAPAPMLRRRQWDYIGISDGSAAVNQRGVRVQLAPAVRRVYHKDNQGIWVPGQWDRAAGDVQIDTIDATHYSVRANGVEVFAPNVPYERAERMETVRVIAKEVIPVFFHMHEFALRFGDSLSLQSFLKGELSETELYQELRICGRGYEGILPEFDPSYFAALGMLGVKPSQVVEEQSGLDQRKLLERSLCGIVSALELLDRFSGRSRYDKESYTGGLKRALGHAVHRGYMNPETGVPLKELDVPSELREKYERSDQVVRALCAQYNVPLA